MKNAMVLPLVLMLAGCGVKPAGDRVQTNAGTAFYTDWSGKLFRVDGDKLFEVVVRKAPDTNPHTLTFSTAIPGSDTDSGFPAKATGSLKLEGDIMKVKLSLQLLPAGNRNPTSQDQARFADALAEGSERIKGITLWFYDAEGYPAGESRFIAMSDEHWSRTVDQTGQPSSYDYSARLGTDYGLAKETATVALGWTSRPRPVAANPFLDPRASGPQPNSGDAAATAPADSPQ